MRTNSKTLIICAASLLLTAFVPSIAAVETPPAPTLNDVRGMVRDAQGCPEADRGESVTVFAPPGALVTNWAPQCVKVELGATVVWQNLDAAPVEAHGARAAGCFGDIGRLTLPGATQSVRFEIDPDYGDLETYVTKQDGSQVIGICDNFADNGDGTLTVTYDCTLHGAPMTAKIIIEA